MKYILSLCLVAVMSVLFTGCRTATIQSVETRISASNKTAMERAIVAGCLERDWTPRKVKDGEYEATLHARSHVAVVTIPYTADSYKIIYKSSENLKYDQASGSIHSNYVNWVKNLDRSISRQLIKDELMPTGSGK